MAAHPQLPRLVGMPPLPFMDPLAQTLEAGRRMIRDQYGGRAAFTEGPIAMTEPQCEGLAPFHCGNPSCPAHANNEEDR